jgi:CDP-diacylglycerol--glycerol-3-phosphate 3-phosphatidyltransferase
MIWWEWFINSRTRPLTLRQGDANMNDSSNNVMKSALNVPNQLTVLRLILSVVLFCFVACQWYLFGMVLFLIAAGTDWLDGYYARRYGLVTTLGRILDPFADKVIICGTFIFLVAVPAMAELPWGLRAWMVVVIVGRELLVTALRSFLEERGADFSAKMPGKLKMVLQCVAACTALVYLSYVDKTTVPIWIMWLLIASLWSAVLLTLYSGAGYVVAAVKLLR